MLIPDVNVLIYAHDAACPAHARARVWRERALSGVEPIGIPWVVALAFVRLTTHPTLSDKPMTIAQSRSGVESWFEMPHVRLLAPTHATLSRFFDLLESSGGAGNLTTDALIAAHAVEMGARVCTNDRDFARFPNVSCLNPLFLN